jgi:hypothetical protein
VVSRFFARIAIGIALVLVAVVAAFVAVGFFAFALYLFIAQFLVPPLAALATGLVILLTVLLLVWIAGQTMSPRKRKPADSPSLEACESAAELGSALGARLRGIAEAHGSGSLWAALIAGFAVGVSPKLRKFLGDILKF